MNFKKICDYLVFWKSNQAIDELIQAVKEDNSNKIIKLIKDGININARKTRFLDLFLCFRKREAGWTALMYAIDYNKPHAANALLGFSSNNLTLKNSWGEDALIMALKRNNEKMADMIIRKLGSNINISSNPPGLYKRALIVAVKNRYKESVRQLLSYCPTIKTLKSDKEMNHYSEYLNIIGEALVEATKRGEKQIVKQLLESKIFKLTPDNLIIRNPSFVYQDVVDELYGSKISRALVYACYINNPELVEMIINHAKGNYKINLDLRDEYGKTALDYAHSSHSQKNIELLTSINPSTPSLSLTTSTLETNELFEESRQETALTEHLLSKSKDSDLLLATNSALPILSTIQTSQQRD